MLENTEFDAEGKPIEKTDFIDDADVSKETEDSNADAINLQSVEMFLFSLYSQNKYRQKYNNPNNKSITILPYESVFRLF